MIIELWTASLTIAYIALFIVGFMQFVLFGPFFGLVQSLAPLRARALATAFIFFIYSGIGFGLGPLYAGALSDYFAVSMGEAQGLKYALTTIPFFSIAGGLIVLFGRDSVSKDLAVNK